MKLIHHSRLPEYREPFGAVTAGSTVSLSLRIEDAPDAPLSVRLRTWVDGKGERLHTMQQGEDGLWHASLACPRPSNVWYTFHVSWEEGDTGRLAHLGAPQGHTGGEGVMYDYAGCPSFQISVYRHRAVRPAWYEKGMVYQIFPDRYRRDDNWRERTEAALARPRNGVQRRLIEDWWEPPVYERNEDGSIKYWDFYGGSLKGIEEDLPRLSELGITAIYLNPIFEAASNHRYDTADYLTIDPILGTEEDFRDLCAAAEKLGMHIILDGVFNHTGDDSLYFNRFGNYPGDGAWNNPASPWRDAYEFNDDGTYKCWWGIDNMPDFNQDSPLVRELLLGEDGVIRHWTRAGAHGWRLDVADELHEDLIADIKETLLQEKPDGLLLGEVWEDASNKMSYGQPRHYLQGDELDSAMNYPFRTMVIDFLMGNIDAAEAAEVIWSLVENYPPEALACALNLLGSHDRPRIASVLGGGPDESKLPEEERGRWRLSPEAMGLAKARFWLATLMQMTFPGVPSIYYGDEYGLEGLSDPGNRRGLPRPGDPHEYDMETIIKNAAGVRRELPVLVDGTIRPFAPTEDVLGYTRENERGEAATVLINRSRTTDATVRIPALGACATDVVSGTELTVGADGMCEVHLWPFGSAVVSFHPEARLQKPLAPGAGVVCHITSLPTDDGRPGTLGEPAKRFIDHLAAMGFTYWQVLPVNPTDLYRSPYAGPSAFAGNIALLPETEEELRADYVRWEAAGGAGTDIAYRDYVEDQRFWLEPYCAFMAVKKHFGGTSRHEWPQELSRYRPQLLKDPRFATEAHIQSYLQYRFELAWQETMGYANAQGIQVIGDIPMYVSDDSADAWANPELFNLDRDGRPTEIAGAPPDNFAPEGQVWGNPTYRWDALRADGYRWWLARLRRAIRVYDRVRLDHFLGFHNFFSIPAGAPGSEGRWIPGPGRDLFEKAASELGPLPFIAEDLGVLTPGVRALVSACGFPGMDVLLFEDYDIRAGIHPKPEKILYTSTHDTATLAGFCAASYTGGDEAASMELAQKLVEDALASDADVVMMPLQDVLGLGDDCRMNVPGVAEGNWSWQAEEADIAAAEAAVAALLSRTGRFAGEVREPSHL
ncbi:4-alpha-glucanotransferase [Collinsella sp. An268]|uniref:4-alpha-glucanotransferase n=1 Tax=Collinsella sp. An268 TaxID=1965612 RepID=UPI000B369120|nr:4-alpha-glucanotransferase [Collinsella sp. An268]OUO65415.1 4-alpha-glucanotransferase [Collinsella sp. An268]